MDHRCFTQETFDACDFTQCNLTFSKFLECKFQKCNFALVKFDGSRLQEVEFINCKFVGVNFGKCDPLFLKMKLKDCLIDTSNFSDLDLKGTHFQNCMIRDTHFINTKLVEASFVGCDLRGSTFHNTDLSRANFQTAINYSISPLTNKLQKAKFSKPEVFSLLDHFDLILE